MSKNIVHKGIFSDDIMEDVLIQTGLHDLILEGKINCMHCGVLITKENLGSITKTSEGHKPACQKTSCVSAANRAMLASRSVTKESEDRS